MSAPALTDAALDGAVARGVRRLHHVRRPDGSWQDHVSSSASATGVCLVALHLADPDSFVDRLQRGCRWLRNTQHADGGWGDAVVDPGNLNSTAFAVAALHRCNPDDSAAERGRMFIEGDGGITALRDRARCSLSPVVLSLWSLAGLCPPREVPRVPLALALFPTRTWRRVAFTMPAVFSLGILQNQRNPQSLTAHVLTRTAEPRAMRYLAQAQGDNGGYQESPLLNGVVYVGLRAAGRDGALTRRCLKYILDTQRSDGSWPSERDLELSVTTLLLDALDAAGGWNSSDAGGLPLWLLNRQFVVPFCPTGCPAGGWSWGYPSGWPDSEDTAGALSALLRLGVPPTAEPMRRGFDWLTSMQNGNGSWGMFVRNSRVTIDRPCPALTARVLDTLYRCDGDGGEPARRARAYLRTAQRPNGSFDSLWFRNHTYATGLILEVQGRIGRPDPQVADRCTRWLLDNQNDDGSWGGRRGEPGTAEETGSAVAALGNLGVGAPAEALDRGARWLVAAQRPDGTWNPSVLGVYYHSLRYSSEHVANSMALRGLARYRRHRHATVACG
jgi:squalene-hopene/tetraprenyl-beta-curcumene cyclase